MNKGLGWGRGKEINLPCRSIPSNVCRYSSSRRWSLTPLLKGGLSMVTSFQRVQYGKGVKNNNFTVEKPEKYYFSQVIKVNINSD